MKTKQRLTFEDYGIDLADPTRCPRCDSWQMELDLKKENWYCGACHWRGHLESAFNSIVDADEAAPALVRWHQEGMPTGESSGFPTLDENIKFVRGEWTCITGHAGQGKTHFADSLIVNLCNKNWKFAMFSPEQRPYERHVKNLAQKFLGKRFRECSLDEIHLARLWLKSRIFFVRPPEPTLESVLAQFKKLVKEQKVKGVIIDPWNELEHEIPKGLNETQYTGKALIRWGRFCEAFHVHGFIVAHPSKELTKSSNKNVLEFGKRPVVRLIDISGSAHFENKAFNGISVWRNPLGEDSDKHANHIWVLKVRNEDIGRVGHKILHWQPESTCYMEPEDLEYRAAGDDYKAELTQRFGSWEVAVRKQIKEQQPSLDLLPWKKEGNIWQAEDAGFKAVLEIIQFGKPGEDGFKLFVHATITKGGKTVAEDEHPTSTEAKAWAEQLIMKMGLEQSAG